VERFHLFCALAFVLVEDMNNSGTWRPSRGLAWQCAYFLGAEVVIGVSRVPALPTQPSDSVPHAANSRCESVVEVCMCVLEVTTGCLSSKRARALVETAALNL